MESVPASSRKRYASRMHDDNLEPARAADAPCLAVMSRNLVEPGLSPSWPAARIAWHIRHPESVVLTAKAAREITGFAIMQFGDDTAHLILLAVAPHHRRRGIARQLLSWLEETALTAGTFSITLELRATNVEAHTFYASRGYREIGRVTGYYEGVEDAIRMVRDVRIGHHHGYSLPS